jgi:putative membrane protein
LIQALLLSLGELLYVGIQCVHPLLFILCSCVNGLVFTLIVYSLVFALENLGLAVSVIVMILQVAGGGGSFPVEVLPRPFQIMFPFMPFRYAMDALRECIGGTYGATWAKCLGILLLMGAAAIAFGLLLHKPMKGIIEKIEESKRESDVML